MPLGALHLDGALIVYVDKPALTGKIGEHIQRRSKRCRTFHCLRSGESAVQRLQDIAVTLAVPIGTCESFGMLPEHHMSLT